MLDKVKACIRGTCYAFRENDIIAYKWRIIPWIIIHAKWELENLNEPPEGVRQAVQDVSINMQANSADLATALQSLATAGLSGAEAMNAFQAAAGQAMAEKVDADMKNGLSPQNMPVPPNSTLSHDNHDFTWAWHCEREGCGEERQDGGAARRGRGPGD